MVIIKEDFKKYTVTYSVIALCFTVFLLQQFMHGKIEYLLFLIPERIVDNVEIWRVFTPALLHFGFFHILFNVLIFSFFGQLIETGFGWVKLLLMFFIFSGISNLFQYLISQSYTFGGLSGVVSGVVGYCVIIALSPSAAGRYKMAVGLCLINIVFNIIEYFSDSHVAFGAHAAGLVAGLVWGIIDYRKMAAGMGRRETIGDIFGRLVDILKNR